MISILRITAALMTAAIATSTSATEPLTMSVSYAGLNLASPAGAAELNRRIDAAIGYVCPLDMPRDLVARALRRNCMVETAARVRPVVALVVAQAAPTEVALNGAR